jgi:uncharacterized coiled-coil protein SlyX
MNRMIQLKQTTPVFLVVLLLCFGVLQGVQAVVPPPDGGYPNFNTAEGQNALFSLTTGQGNTAVGWLSLRAVTQGSLNTATGAGTLLANTGDRNTATGAGALLSTTTGTENTANGAFALFSNTEGGANTADGVLALFNNTTGIGNTANGWDALSANTTGINNTALGVAAGQLQTSGDGNVYIGANMVGVAGESNACYIRSIFNQTSSSGIPVLINSSNKLGTTTSSKRFKEEIKSMGEASEALLALKPVTFRYTKEIDPHRTPQFGLVAEEVEKVDPALIVRDKEGKPYSVRYDQVNAMLLNEFLKAHKKVEEQQSKVEKQEALIAELKSTVAEQQKRFVQQEAQIQALASSLQKVSAQIESRKGSPRTVLNNQ